MNPHISRLTTEFLNDMNTDYYDTSKTNFDSEPDGVYIIIRGTCKIVNRLDGFDSGELSENENKACYKIFFSDCFGEFDTLKISDYTIYGDIYVRNHLLYSSLLQMCMSYSSQKLFSKVFHFMSLN